MTLDGISEELEPVISVKILNLLRIERHLHLLQFTLQYIHGFLVVLTNEENVIRISDVISVKIRQHLIDME